MSPESPRQVRMTPIPNSEHHRPQQGTSIGPTPANQEVMVTVVLKRRQPLDLAGMRGRRMSRQEYTDQYGASQAAIDQITAFAAQHGLSVVETSRARRRVFLRGTVAQMQAAFGVTLNDYEHAGRRFHALTGPISVPETALPVVEAVLGLDTRPIAQPHIRYLRQMGNVNPKATAAVSYTPPQVAQVYDFPTGVDGTGECIALIELGGGFTDSDIQTYFQQLGLTPPTVVAVPVDGGSNAPGDPSGADGEVALDIQVAGGIAPGARIAVYFAPNTNQGFQDAISTAIHDTTNNPSVISISWGGPESTWPQNALTSFDSTMQTAAALGITITVACGDNGSTDGVSDGANHVDFPASSPHVLACGGTDLTVSGSERKSETVWNDLSQGGGATGGGVSDFFAKPSWQSGVSVPKPTSSAGGRGTPDVAGDAAPATGYQILVDGQSETVGGTSAVAPLWAGLLALSNQKAGKPAGFINPTLYAAGESGFFDVTKGSNGSFSAAKGWDPCTGLGSPDGTKIAAVLSGGS